MFGLIGLAFFQEYCKIKALAKENGGVGWGKSLRTYITISFTEKPRALEKNI